MNQTVLRTGPDSDQLWSFYALPKLSGDCTMIRCPNAATKILRAGIGWNRLGEVLGDAFGLASRQRGFCAGFLCWVFVLGFCTAR